MRVTSAVEPSMSVKQNVTVPDGSARAMPVASRALQRQRGVQARTSTLQRGPGELASLASAVTRTDSVISASAT